MLHEPLRSSFRLDFCLPSECARRLQTGESDVGIVPVIEIHRQGLLTVPGTGIACDGPVRSILLISRVPPARIRRMATDSGSRTSVALARLILRERYETDPEMVPADPDLARMLETADAALLIGDAALRVQPESLPFHVLDLGQEWHSISGLPMVFALWAGQPGRVRPLLDAGLEHTFRASLEYGTSHLNTIVEEESRARGFALDLVQQYLTRFIRYQIGSREKDGLAAFLELAAPLDSLLPSLSTRC